ncbi:O-methyltransferase [Taylorella equigenitalis]|uniref:O-methyltransferase family protein n=2 Tax=Taylorella equigenitalis TaxID=29575 RepID=I7IXX1_9BURK|nr:O-methyltransferase [Taylorella equigenitalis]AFN35515.1 O-methyltransferase family protein [Taylorella equigenitalis ATCC 35865]ASY30166.1 methyltransferase [Taylorella equigenitalis]ASY37474.1 O-methyltransferase [Taylorella equigenitalis]ASY38943.1 methyltransferase [Taylorella equigenitalis]ASY40462.1 methyltransferase [Taylorella equigenitalis]
MRSRIMESELPDQVDELIFEKLHGETDDLKMSAILDFHKSLGLPGINVPPNHGKFLNFLIRISGARRVLEIGTLAGYSTVWMALALPTKGQIVTLDFDPNFIEIAHQTFEMAGVTDKVRLIEGRAMDSLKNMKSGEVEPFDFVFIDADKEHNADYLELCMPLLRKGAIVVADNMVRDGKVVNGTDNAPNIRGIRRFIQMLHDDSRLDSTLLQTIGQKGWDGFAITLVK